MKLSEFKALQKQKNPRIFALIRKRRLKKAAKLILICSAISVVTSLTLQGMNRPEIVPVVCGIAAAVCLLVVCLSAPRGLFFGRDFAGRVEAIELNVRGAASENSIRGMVTRTYADLSVLDEMGKRHRIALDRKYEACYRVGDEIVFLHGIELPFHTETPPDRPTACWCCGSIKSAGEVDCLMCGREFYP